MPPEAAVVSAVPAAPAPGAGAQPPKPGETGKADPGAKPGETAAAAAARRKKYVVDGGEVEVDLADEKAIDTLIQKGLGADKRFAETAKQRKEAEMLVSMLQSNPMAVLERTAKLYGKDARKMVEDWLWDNHVKLEQLTPEQREAETNKRKLSDFEAREKERTAKEQQEQFERTKQHYRGVFEKDIIGALEKGGLPKTAYTVQRMAHYMSQALKAKVKVSAADVVPLVQQDFEGGFRDMFSVASPETMAKIIGEDGMKKLRTWELERLKAQGVRVPATGEQRAPEEPKAPKERTLTKEEWRKGLDQRVGR